MASARSGRATKPKAEGPPKLEVLDQSGKAVGEQELDPAVFAVQVNVPVMHQVVVAGLAAARQGSHSTKTRAEVSGGGRKPWRQKGTGRARAGTTRAAQWTGGGHAFALRPRSYEVKVNRKARRSALRGALAAHASRGSLGVIDGSAWEEASTKAAAALVASWDADRPVLVVAQPDEQPVIRSFRNLERVLVVEPSELEVGALVWARSLLATEAALARVQEVAAR
jgi:large subunit ribosomal protein L4